ncbi:MAG: glycosyltransferase family 2 protein [Candidatus Chisholmbacteria bacterium]|nr:glycosyltransferase family 2 protein [Candidatus Chisholmbacteria bacterium]
MSLKRAKISTPAAEVFRRLKITAIVLTRNEAANIASCLKTISWCDQILLIDNSTDDTIPKSKKIIPTPKLRIIHSSQDNFAYLRNLGLHKARFSWVFFVDADHRVPRALRHEILTLLKSSPQYKAYRIKQQDVVFKRELSFGETAHVAHVLLGKKTAGFWRRRVHEKWHVRGNIGTLQHPIRHFPHQNLEEFLGHINRWSTLDAQEFNAQKITAPLLQVIVFPVAKFLYNYFWRLGFIDGIPGLIVAYVMSLHSLSVRIKLRQLL